ncbi:hypothetical protein [Amycolatopsis sp. WAC 01375]|nr:hypothetical protein [Amycolatopsis sp. WAC 01375]
MSSGPDWDDVDFKALDIGPWEIGTSTQPTLSEIALFNALNEVPLPPRD